MKQQVISIKIMLAFIDTVEETAIIVELVNYMVIINLLISYQKNYSKVLSFNNFIC